MVITGTGKNLRFKKRGRIDISRSLFKQYDLTKRFSCTSTRFLNSTSLVLEMTHLMMKKSSE